MVDLSSASTPDLVTLETLGNTYEKRPIYALRVAPKSGVSVCRLLILGGHHAREWIAAEVPYLIGERFVRRAADSRISALLERAEVWIVPVVNPDGSDYSHLPDSGGGDRTWRKNRRPVGANTAGRPIFGVDLNRNYDIDFRGGGGTSSALGAENYPGEQAFSELETQAICNLVQRFEFQFAVSYHSFSQEVLYPFGFINPECDSDCVARLNNAKKLAANMAAAMGMWHGAPYVAKATLERYPTSGDCADWLLGKKKIVAVTVELPPRSYDDPDERFMMDSAEIMPIFEGAWAGIVGFAEDALGKVHS
jgi:carboxypeptidase T